MNDQNRVLLRRGARDLNDQEVAMVAGGLRTLTACTLAAAGTLDGDTFHSECGSPDQLPVAAVETSFEKPGPLNGPNDERRKR